MRRFALSLIFSSVVSSAALAQQSSSLDIDDVIELMRLSPSADTRAAFIRKSCISFPLTTGAVTRLKTAGANDQLIDVIKNACFSGAEVVVESLPSGADVIVDGQPVGKAPWSGRYAAGARPLAISVRSGSKTQTANAPLDAGKRVKAMFSFAADTVPVPVVRSTADVVSELGLEQQWRPTVPAPRAPSVPSKYGNFLVSAIVLGGATYGGVQYCSGTNGGCGFKVELDEEGTDTNEPYRKLAGGTAGFVAGAIVNKLIGATINSMRGRSYEGKKTEYLRKQEEWNRAMDGAKAEWMRSHPEVQRILRNENAARQSAIEQNKAIKASNAELPPSAVKTEPLN